MSEPKELSVHVTVVSPGGVVTEHPESVGDPAEFQAFLDDLGERIKADPTLIPRAMAAGELAAKAMPEEERGKGPTQ